MTITDQLIHDQAPSTSAPQTARPNRRRPIVAAAVALVAAAGAVATLAVVRDSDDAPERVTPSRDEFVRDLVDRGVVPAATLDDGTHIVSPLYQR